MQTIASTRSLEPRPGLDSRIGISRLPGAAALQRTSARTGIRTVRDLFFHLPRRYEDLREVSTAARLRELPEGSVATARLVLISLRVDQTFRRRVQRTTAVFRDDTGEVEATWFGRRYIEKRLHEGEWVILSGRLRHRGFAVQLDDPEFQRDDGSTLLHAGRIVPVYRLTRGLTSRVLRSAIRAALDGYGPYREYLPGVATEMRLMDAGAAIEQVHFPEHFEDRDRALERLAFDELLALQIGMLSRRRRRGTEDSEPIGAEEGRLSEAVGVVENVIGGQVRRRRDITGAEEGTDAVRLTGDQRAAIQHIRSDLTRDLPMLRLLQGDVGSGKTAVAAVAMAIVADAHRQAALLAPTDLLARQHAVTLGALLEPLGHGVTLLTGSMSAAGRRDALDLLAAPMDVTPMGLSQGRIVVGTHALVQEAVSFADLRLVVVDEQHRFGVSERESMGQKGIAPHVLLMSATPIPRTLGQVLHADLDVSDLRAAPSGRQPILTAIRQPSELVRRADGRPGSLAHLANEVAAGRRGFIVVPLVADDEGSEGTSVGQAETALRSAWEEACVVGGAAGTPLSAEIVHGQLKASERDERMERFRSGETSIVIGTTVLEVGVDVPEASLMIIMDADRFGVAQLHQLRGRVGRGEARSGCVLVSAVYPRAGLSTDRMSEDQRVVKARLDALVEHQDGFRLAELDLALRREGELLGLQQSGLPPLRVASLAVPRHRELSLVARQVAEGMVDEGGRLRPGNAAFAQELATGWLRRVGAGEVLGVDEMDA